MNKEFLKDHVKKLKEQKELQSELNAIYITLKSPAITGLPLAHQSEPDKIGNIVAKIQEKEIKLLAKLDAIIAEEEEIEKVISKLETTERILMRYRYIQGLDWEKICVEMHYSWQHIHKIHKRILEKIKDETKCD